MTHLLLLRKNLANILFLLSKYYENNEKLYEQYVQNLLVSGYISDFKKIYNKHSTCLNNSSLVTWNKIQQSSSIYEKEKIEIIFSQYIYRVSDKNLKNELLKKNIQYYKDSLCAENYINQEMILNFISNNIENIPIQKFIPLISQTLKKYQNEILNRLVDNIFKNVKCRMNFDKYISDLNIIFKYCIDNKLQDVYLYLNFKKIYNKYCDNYDVIVLNILESDLQFAYKELTKVKVNYYEYLMECLDELENSNKVFENYRLRNLLYIVNKLKDQNLKEKVIKRYINISKKILIKNDISINSKIFLIKKILELYIYSKKNKLIYINVFFDILKNKEAILQVTNDLFETEEYIGILELYLDVLNNIILNQFDDGFTIKILNMYNKNKIFKDEILFIIVLLIRLNIVFDLRSIIINIYKDINDSELQDNIIYIFIISYQQYSLLYKELIKNINITEKTEKLLIKNKKNGIYNLLYNKK